MLRASVPSVPPCELTPTRICLMNTRPFGRLGWPVSEIGYGMWGMGGWSGSNDDESLAAIERSI